MWLSISQRIQPSLHLLCMVPRRYGASLQRKACLAINGVLGTTSCEALNRCLDLTPLDIYIKIPMARIEAYHLRLGEMWHSGGHCQIRITSAIMGVVSCNDL